MRVRSFRLVVYVRVYRRSRRAVCSTSSPRKLYRNFNHLNGTIPDSLYALPQLTVLNLNFNSISGTLSTEIGQFASIETLRVSVNLISGTIPSELGMLSSSLIGCDLYGNRLNGTMPSEIGNLTKLSYLNLNGNELTGALPFLGDLTQLESLNLEKNRLTHIPAGVFDGIISNRLNPSATPLRSLIFSFQSTPLKLSSGAFRGIENVNRIVLAGNRVRTIPSFLFGDEHTSTLRSGGLDLSGLHIHTVQDDAFQMASSSTGNVSIDLSRNVVVNISPRAFRSLEIDAYTYECVNVGSWDIYFGIDVFDCTTFSNLGDQCLNGLCTAKFVNKKGAGDLTVLDACCQYGGGYHYGTRILMDDVSPVTCHAATPQERDANVSSHGVICSCGDSSARYETNTSSCITSCDEGEIWVNSSQETGSGAGISPSLVGRCVSCERGREGRLGSGWSETCSDCSPGRFARVEKMTSCVECPSGMFTSTNQSSSCTSCAPGSRSSERRGSIACVTCAAGQYSTTSASSICRVCSSGRFSHVNATACDACEAGRAPNQGEGAFSCADLPAGQFGTGKNCPENTYSTAGSAACSRCPWGKSSKEGSQSCMVCDFAYLLTEHCDFPLTGLLVCAILTLTSVLLYYRFHIYRRERVRRAALTLTELENEMKRSHQLHNKHSQQFMQLWLDIQNAADFSIGVVTMSCSRLEIQDDKKALETEEKQSYWRKASLVTVLRQHDLDVDVLIKRIRVDEEARLANVKLLRTFRRVLCSHPNTHAFLDAFCEKSTKGTSVDTVNELVLVFIRSGQDDTLDKMLPRVRNRQKLSSSPSPHVHPVDLSGHVRQSKVRTIRVLRWMYQCADALCWLHENGLAHGNVRGSSVMLFGASEHEQISSLKERAVLSDPWFLRLVTSSATATREAQQHINRTLDEETEMGEHHTWVPPEWRRERSCRQESYGINPAADVYALGELMRQLTACAIRSSFTSTSSFRRRPFRKTSSSPLTLRRDSIHRLVRKCTRDDPDARPSARHVRDRLKKMISLTTGFNHVKRMRGISKCGSM